MHHERAAGPGTGLAGAAPGGLSAKLKAYAAPDVRQSILQLLVTLVAFAALWSGMWLTLDLGYWITLLLSVPAAGFLVRLFVIQHDCGHHSYFRSRRANDMVGRALGVLTLTPYGHWRNLHATHHATSGNLDRRGVGDIKTLTVREYQALTPRRRLVYRLFRNPLVLFGLIPTFLFVVLRRLPIDAPTWRRAATISVVGNNAALAGLIAAMMALVGTTEFLMVQLPIVMIASAIGVKLFFVQHQFEQGYWRAEGEWSFEDAALRGCSYLRLPRPLQWLTANIGLHHVHHLNCRIPNYRLQDCVDRIPELAGTARRLSLRDGLRCAPLALWCEESRRLIRFRDLRPKAAPVSAATGCQSASP